MVEQWSPLIAVASGIRVLKRLPAFHEEPEKATRRWLVLQRWRRRILEMPSMARIEDVKIRPHSFSVGMLAAEATGVTPPGVADAVLTKLAKVNHPPSAAP